MKTVLALFSLLAFSAALPKQHVYEFEQPEMEGKHWALLVAGSNTWMNYRHQADACHAYQIMRQHGIAEDHIVTMMYDDIAENRENPEKGVIINQPNGPNVYQGVKIDYTGEDVTPDNFLNILQGKSDKVSGGTGRVISSGPNDHVFVNFVDHGAPGLVAFPDDVLHAKDLMDAINYMYEKKKYSKMVFYIEACESGSMFYDLLPKNINVYATTASNQKESSYACYFDKERKTYLGDVYSEKWMQDSDKEDLTTETLQKQFEITKEETKTSHVMEYGDLKIGKMTVGEFQGNQASKKHLVEDPIPPKYPCTIGQMTVAEFQGMQTSQGGWFFPHKTTTTLFPPRPKYPCKDAVRSEDVPLAILNRTLELTDSKEEKMEILQKRDQLLKERAAVRNTFKSIVYTATNDNGLAAKAIDEHNDITKWDCYRPMVDYMAKVCQKKLNIPENDYALRHLYQIVNLCESNIDPATIRSAIDKNC